MKKQLLTLVVLMAVLCPKTPIFAGELSDSRTLRESIVRQAHTGARLIVDNIWGSVEVHGYAGDEIEMVALETVRAKSAVRIEQARSEVKIDISQTSEGVEIYVDGPFRCQRDRDQRGCWSDWDSPYTVIYDFEIRVPYETDLDVRTVTDGDIEVVDVRGDFQIRNVNGSIDLAGLAGAGAAATVNGPVVASFTVNPSSDTHFETVNGKIDVSFQPGLSAELDMLARWGELWSEYEVTALPSKPPTQRTKGDRTIIELSRGTRVRVENGGPTHSFETLNGNIYVRKGTSERGENDA